MCEFTCRAIALAVTVALAPSAGGQIAALRAGDGAFTRRAASAVSAGPTPAAADYVNIRDFGACGDNICDDTAAVRKALAAYPNGRVRIHFPSGIYLITDTIAISKDRVTLEGDGRQATIVHFVPAAAKTLFVFKKTGSDIVQCGISGMGLWGDNAETKVGIQLVSTSETHISDIATYPWTGLNSIGIQIQGHDFGLISDVEITAPKPIVIERNTNNPADAGIDIDHFEFQGLYLIGDHEHPLIDVAAGVNLTNVTFDGRQAWAFGTHGFYFNDSSTVRAGLNLAFKNVRWEQSTYADGYIVYVAHKSGFYNISFENMYSGSYNNNSGYYLRNVQFVSFTNVIYAGTGMGLDIASKDVSNVSFRNTFFQTGSTVNTAGAATLEGTYQLGGATYTQVPNSSVFKLNPSVLSGINQVESVPIPVAPNGGRAAIGTEVMIGTLYISDGISGVSGSFALAGGFHAVVKVSDPFAHFNAGVSTAHVFNVYWSDAQNQYEIENRTPNAAQFYMTLIGRGEH